MQVESKGAPWAAAALRVISRKGDMLGNEQMERVSALNGCN